MLICYSSSVIFNFNCNRIPVTLLEDVFLIGLTYNQMCVFSENDTEKLQMKYLCVGRS